MAMQHDDDSLYDGIPDHLDYPNWLDRAACQAPVKPSDVPRRTLPLDLDRQRFARRASRLSKEPWG
jgi:hypothetical protein